MFDFISEKFEKSLNRIGKHKNLKVDDVNRLLKDIRVGLLEADVNIKVAKEFIQHLKEKILANNVYKISNAQLKIKELIYDELLAIFDQKQDGIKIKSFPANILFVGLQGTGKTTSVAKLSNFLKQKYPNKKQLLVACDVYRPAAIDQLKTLATQLNVDILEEGTSSNPIELAKKAYKMSHYEGYDIVIYDTAGRLHTNLELMDELKKIKEIVKPMETILTIDAMSGQDLLNTVQEFHKTIIVNSFFLTKLDGSAKGGGAITATHQTKLPIKFAGIGEKIDDIEIFYPKRVVNRLLGLGDIETLKEKFSNDADEKSQKKDVKKFLEGKFDFNDLLKQLKQLKKMGKLKNIIKYLPKMGQISNIDFDSLEKKLYIFETLINSMTKLERKNPKLLKDANRKKRVILGSGRTAQEFNRLMTQFEQAKGMAKTLKNMPVDQLQDINLG